MVENPLNVPDCVARVRDGDEAAARTLVTHLYPLVLKIVRAHRSRRETEDDLAQEVFMKLFTRLETWRGNTPFEHWVARIAVNTCVDHLRAQQRRPELRWSDLNETEAAVLDATLADSATADASHALDAKSVVHKLLETLDPADREVIQMLDLEELPVAEIHRSTGWSASAIKVRAFRARRKLRKELERLEKQKS
jgi:RNA polymerase sigma-70 factor (ECF subfamily)